MSFEGTVSSLLSLKTIESFKYKSTQNSHIYFNTLSKFEIWKTLESIQPHIPQCVADTMEAKQNSSLLKVEEMGKVL